MDCRAPTTDSICNSCMDPYYGGGYGRGCLRECIILCRQYLLFLDTCGNTLSGNTVEILMWPLTMSYDPKLYSI